MKSLIVSLHDVHPGSLEAIRGQVDLLGELGVSTLSLLVVPKFHSRTLITRHAQTMEFLRQRASAGDDLVIHGFAHQSMDNRLETLFWHRLYTNREAEFLDLSNGEVRHRIQLGLDIWSAEGWRSDGFIAPAWLMPKKQDEILRHLGFSYTNRLRSISLLQKKKEIAAMSLCYSTRSAWRRALGITWNLGLFNRLKKGSIIRLSLHPGDLEVASIRQQVREMVEMALAEGFQPVTYARYAAL